MATGRSGLVRVEGSVESESPSFYLFFCFCTILGRFCATESRVGWGWPRPNELKSLCAVSWYQVFVVFFS